MARLPSPGSDAGTWGLILNEYLAVEHNADGTLKRSADITQAKSDAAQALSIANQSANSSVADGGITTSKIADGAVTLSKLNTDIQATLNSVVNKYSKPADGIPSTDLTAAIITSLSKADSSLQPSVIDTDTSLTANSDTALVSQKAAKTYIDNKIATLASGAIFSQGVTLIDPTVGNVIIWRAPYACNVSRVLAVRSGGTGAAINARKNGNSTHLSTDLSLSTAGNWLDGGAVQNSNYSMGDSLEIMITSLSGSPAQLTIQIDFVLP